MEREKLETTNFCECGCGQVVESGNRFIRGHNGKGIPRSETTIERAQQAKKKRKLEKRSIGQPCECGCGEWTSPYCRFINGHNGRNKTKENCISIAIRAAKAKGKTKENDPGRASQAEKMRGRTKENNPGIAAQAKKMTGRTKENDPGKASMVKKLTGRTKENYPGPAAQAEKISGSNHPNWKGGVSFEPYCEVWKDKEYKEDIKKRDNYQCQNPDCWNRDDSVLVIHHINYSKKDCIPFNLITLCKSCNSRANFNRDFWQPFYQDLIDSKDQRQAINL